MPEWLCFGRSIEPGPRSRARLRETLPCCGSGTTDNLLEQMLLYRDLRKDNYHTPLGQEATMSEAPDYSRNSKRKKALP